MLLAVTDLCRECEQLQILFPILSASSMSNSNYLRIAEMRKVAGLVMVRNEADIIEAFVRYNLKFLDELIIVLHSPLDETGEIVEKLRLEGLAVIIKHNRELGFDKSEWMNKIAREILASKRADFLFMLDADEFIKCPSRAYLDDAIAAIPVGATAAVKWESYVPSPDDDASERNVLKRIQHRVADEINRICKVTVCKHFADDLALSIADGNHAVVRGRGEHLRPVPHVLFRGISLAHFPVRSESQLVSKALIGVWSRWVENGRVDKSMLISNHWLRFYQELTASGHVFPRALGDFAVNYDATAPTSHAADISTLIRDPLLADFHLQYTPAGEVSPLANISRWVEMLIDQSSAAPSNISRHPQSVPFQAPRSASH
jgi:hypothetical protein